MDYAPYASHDTVISTGSAESLAVGYTNLKSGAGTADAAWPTANLAQAVPFRLRAPFLVRRLWWLNGSTVSGNVDCGLYALDPVGGSAPVRLLSAGSTAQSSPANKVQSVALGTPVLLTPGGYYLALALDNTTGTVSGWTPSGTSNPDPLVAEATGSFALPATLTLAAAPANRTLFLFGITSSAVI